MILAMILAHLVGDYILQWNSLAAWKAREMKGVIVHCLVLTAVTLLFAALIDPTFLPWAIFISVMHFLIDTFGLKFKLPISPLGRFTVDQLAHFAVIFIALAGGGYIDLGFLSGSLTQGLQSDRLMLYLMGYAFVTMPAWILVKFTAYGLVKGTAPEFGDNSKYLGIFERLLIVTFVALGQFYLAPLIILPRFVMEWPQVVRTEQTAVYLAELLSSVIMAVAIGLLFWLMQGGLL
ncbi:MAG: DUF3307 domain-containing protein [Chloroflexi bacterium]|nr:DUF3307 domain-containing protein [Chloroflexota bacterium]